MEKDVRAVIIKNFAQILEENQKELAGELTDETVLLETGVDSLGFAILVARLEEELGYDPFTLMETAFYPRTFKEFVEIYQKYYKPN